MREPTSFLTNLSKIQSLDRFIRKLLILKGVPMSDQPLTQAASGGPSTPAQSHSFKKGDVVWVIYRKIPWPAKVTAFYPKEKKVSYVFFPLVQKNSVFKADPSKVNHFTLDDQLPDDAAPDLEESFNQARRLLEGMPEEEIIAEYSRKAEEVGAASAKKKKSLTTADVLKKATPKGTPKRIQQKQAIPTPKSTQPVFKRGDPVIVDTPMGMWPGMFLSFEKQNTQVVNYSLFPREEHTHEVMQAAHTSILPFPPDQVEQAIEEGRNNNSEMLLAALFDVQSYMEERETEKAQKRQSSSGIGTATTTPKEKETPSAKVKKQPQVELTPPREIYKSARKSAPRKAVPMRLSKGDEENETMAKKATSPIVQKQGKAILPIAEPTAKKRKIEEMGENGKGEDGPSPTKSLPPMGANIAKHSPIKQAKSAQGEGGRRLSEVEREKQFQHLGELVEKKKRESELKVEQKQQPLKAEQQQSISSPPTVPKAISPINKPVDAKRDSSSSLYELALTDKCKEHFEKLLDERANEWLKGPLNVEELNLDFRNGGLFTFKEMENLVSEVQTWIADNVYGKQSLPRFSQLREMHLISKYILPEICTFVLAEKNDCTLEEAKQNYTEKYAVSLLPSSPPNSSPLVSPPQQKPNNSLSTLIEAANMMEGSKEQNGTNSNNEGQQV